MREKKLEVEVCTVQCQGDGMATTKTHAIADLAN